MLRVRLPAGAILPHQMRAVAVVSRDYGDGILHVTTRQDIQVHSVPLEGIHPALVRLSEAGLSTKGGGGNTVRNITACFDAGVCPGEVFDVSPYVAALTEFLLPDPASHRLPRKYKIAFSGCSHDCAGATVNDLGFVAGRRGGEAGFSVYVAGGMGARSRVADRLEEFVPATDIHFVAEAVKRVFDQHGNRKNRNRARLRFLVHSIGLEHFQELYHAELSELRRAGLPGLQVRALPSRDRKSPSQEKPAAEGFGIWRKRNVVPQKQQGYCLVHIPLMLGDIPADPLQKLADVVEAHGEGMIRTTQWQNMVIRWVPEGDLTGLHRKLAELGLAEALAPILRNTVACTGAATCKLGICLSRGLARAIADKLVRGGFDLDGLGELNLHISGCPNACGRHPIARIGMFGAARRLGGRLVPHYTVQLGGKVGEGETKLAQEAGSVPARNVPAFMVEFLEAFRRSAQFPNYDAFLEAGGRKVAEQLAADYRSVPPFEEDKNYYFDWGAETPFSLAGRGPGECGAGVFDLIEVDLASARAALGEGKLFAAVCSAARALLVTQGQEPRDDADALRLFRDFFVGKGLVGASSGAIVEDALRSAVAAKPAVAFSAKHDEVVAFVDVVQNLYDNMDSSLRFRPTSAEPEDVKAGRFEVAKEADFRGVTCPLNYVKTKLLLGQVAKGQVVSLLLDEQGARNVPASAEQDGHSVVSATQEGGHWRVLIRRG
jgi:sulfite reductase (ferredoxin)